MKASINITGFHRAVLIAITGFVAAYPDPCPATDIIIYSDTFARSGGLNGSQLGVSTGFTGTGGHGGSGSASWTAAASITTDGLSANGGAQKNAYLPFTPETGHVYTYTLELDTLGSGYQWAAMGFDIANQVEQESYDNAIAWALQWQNAASSGIQYCKGPGYSGINTIYPVGDGYNTLSWVLDTTNAIWTARFFINSVAQGPPLTYASPPGITRIGFASSSGLNDGYSVRILKLTVSGLWNTTIGSGSPWGINSKKAAPGRDRDEGSHPRVILIRALHVRHLPVGKYGGGPAVAPVTVRWFWHQLGMRGVVGSGKSRGMLRLGSGPAGRYAGAA